MAKKDNKDVNKVLVENFVSLQRVMTNLSLKLDNLASQISKLLELFEISAKTIAERGSEGTSQGGQYNREFAGKIDNLIEQNKVIARGLALIHEVNSPKQIGNYEIPKTQMQIQAPRKPMGPVHQGFQQSPRKQMRTDEYQKSISNQKDEQDKQP